MMRIIVFTLSALIQLAAAAAGYVVLLISMNGYSGWDATPGINLYIALALGSALGLGLASAFAAGRLVKRRSYGGLAASAVAVLGSFILGGVILVFSFVAAIVVAEVVRGMR
ncbi:MAG TPA: hypothetical protein VGV38_09175 [Pyrinomonadaceae bacterium]|nr:hypothetical protein [Pyrinomonadaceae bacterium]